jgi:hypothetical protein
LAPFCPFLLWNLGIKKLSGKCWSPGRAGLANLLVTSTFGLMELGGGNGKVRKARVRSWYMTFKILKQILRFHIHAWPWFQAREVLSLGLAM